MDDGQKDAWVARLCSQDYSNLLLSVQGSSVAHKSQVSFEFLKTPYF